jgi:imidazolonepropionase
MTTPKTPHVLLGPFDQIVTLRRLPEAGPISDSALEIIVNGGIALRNGRVATVGPWQELRKNADEVHEVAGPAVVLPGFVDAHTHLCYAGNRAEDYTKRLEGKTYQEIAASGGGIAYTMQRTSAASEEQLIALMLRRLDHHRAGGVTTCEIKSGYGLKFIDDLKMLNAIAATAHLQPVTLIPTCLIAHTLPPDFTSTKQFLSLVSKELLPRIRQSRLAQRCDIFVDESGFGIEETKRYLLAAKELGYSLCVHADQFSHGGAALAAEVGALSADHLEASTLDDFEKLQQAGVMPIVLPGSTLGLGMPFPQARAMLNAGLPLVIASDWNPGSAPMGDLLTQAALLGMNQRLTHAETFAALTQRAARALGLTDRGTIAHEQRADLVVFGCSDYREILYYQGALRPSAVYIRGQQVHGLA